MFAWGLNRSGQCGPVCRLYASGENSKKRKAARRRRLQGSECAGGKNLLSPRQRPSRRHHLHRRGFALNPSINTVITLVAPQARPPPPSDRQMRLLLGDESGSDDDGEAALRDGTVPPGRRPVATVSGGLSPMWLLLVPLGSNRPAGVFSRGVRLEREGSGKGPLSGSTEVVLFRRGRRATSQSKVEFSNRPIHISTVRCVLINHCVRICRAITASPYLRPIPVPAARKRLRGMWD